MSFRKGEPFFLTAFGFSVDNTKKKFQNQDQTNLEGSKYSVLPFVVMLTDMRKSSCSTPTNATTMASAPKSIKYNVDYSILEAISQLKRIVAGDFPWAKLDDLIEAGHARGEISDSDLEQWKLVAGKEYLKEVGRNLGGGQKLIHVAVESLHYILLWAIAIDRKWNCPEFGDWLKDFNLPAITLEYVIDKLADSRNATSM
ncbi:hypothetical protein EG329_002887 [Mollisiaceae sp. DMI_Dod_QoI]|nr:hypothetical protein EG329_002887 [Helotiales sp. DMI_Dod_QoI]